MLSGVRHWAVISGVAASPDAFDTISQTRTSIDGHRTGWVVRTCSPPDPRVEL